ncbi:hypothetical protein FPANT_4941 [Fusarium pseudoanthophilum]|uniref:SH3 domain-containing protein n=1 Tax=Fusarium pseudoanthophilum TaxID=48495 RepID=A0A8H5PCH8_9HYPO|nr:hypothetical protein FPANT_4941 [Fusarium pseudoanthophilum]
MATASDHVLLRPFNDVTKWAKLALSHASGHDYQQTSLNQSSQSLLREGERALRRLVPLLAVSSPQLTEFLRYLTLRHEDVICQVRSIDILLYDFEDFIEPQTFDKAKFDELQAATKELAITLVEEITRFTTKSALESPPAPSKFPPLPPLPQLTNPSDVARSSSQMSMRPGRSGSSLGTHQQRPSFISGSEQRDRSHSGGRALRNADYSTTRSPITPGGLASPVSLPLTSKYASPEQDTQTYRYIQAHRRQESGSDAVLNSFQGLDIGAITPPSSVALSPKSTGYRNAIDQNTRGSYGYDHQDTPPPSVTTESVSQPDWSTVTDQQSAAVPRPVSVTASQFTGPEYRNSGSYKPAAAPPEHQQLSIITQGLAPSIRSDGSGASGSKAVSTSSSSMRKDSVSVKSVHSLQTYEIGPDSSLFLLGGLCKGARAFASGGPGQAIKRVGGGSDGAIRPREYSQEMLFGQMLDNPTETLSEPTAQCLHCDYKTPYSHLRQDMDQDPLASQQTRGILHRPRFLFKSHIAVRNVNSVYFGCLFCDKTKSTLQEDDATVFQSIDLLFRHISRHTHPLPHVPGVEVVYEHSDVNSRGRQDCDLYFPNSTMTALHGISRANDSNRLASLPVARALKDHIRRSNEKPQARPDATSEVLQFVSGARIIGVEFPEKWDGKWCQGWHDGVFGTFPSKLISLDMPRHVKIASLPNTPRTGVARWKFEKQKQPGWLALKKGDIICNLACEFSIISNLTEVYTDTVYRGGSTCMVLEWFKFQERVWNISSVSYLDRVYKGRVTQS